jgi:hypothetical protein
MRATVTDAREPVCVHINAPGAVGAAQAHSPRGCLARSGYAIATLSLERRGAVACPGARARALKLPSKSAQQGQRLHV